MPQDAFLNPSILLLICSLFCFDENNIPTGHFDSGPDPYTGAER